MMQSAFLLSSTWWTGSAPPSGYGHDRKRSHYPLIRCGNEETLPRSNALLCEVPRLCMPPPTTYQ